ncbi:MAG: 50S ribosomal protein L11 methyltransferase [Bacteroidetes bacterium]|nr:50S ribosomal protein L11 methyltransferase [Bacteroidota bacterium]
MSFGTGHHETTEQILALMLPIQFHNMKVCDMGCGTGILAVMAEKLGASTIDAVDYDEQCVINAQQNIARNNCTRISIYNGDANWLVNKSYDIFIANINRNIILSDLNAYSKSIQPDGLFICSGFYQDDLDEITRAAAANQLHYREHRVKKNWCAAVFYKK